MPKDVVVGVVEDVLDLQADPVSGDTEAAGLLVVHLPSLTAGDHSHRADRRGWRRLGNTAQPCPLRRVLILTVIRHGRDRSEHASRLAAERAGLVTTTPVVVPGRLDRSA
ncbi:hypothetical protein OG711_38635 (plasmid) [Streptomyces uncialis]|uniref:hypothetical protein n=1 Tax=Streptomyces uncialis TaxID=1048205 RepID=UPI002E3614E4|nr:hypothetical protein [Streptomyces uncialis]